MSNRIVVAKQLRRYTNISKAKTHKKTQNSSSLENSQLEEQKRIFMEGQFEESELKVLLQKIVVAAREGQYELEVMEFPSDFCTDGGRAINNNEKTWPQTLQGKAKNFHTIWQQHGQPKGYRLKVRVNNYPRGFIGDISLLVDWS